MCLRGEHRGLLLAIVETQTKHLLGRPLSYSLSEGREACSRIVGRRGFPLQALVPPSGKTGILMLVQLQGTDEMTAEGKFRRLRQQRTAVEGTEL